MNFNNDNDVVRLRASSSKNDVSSASSEVNPLDDALDVPRGLIYDHGDETDTMDGVQSSGEDDLPRGTFRRRGAILKCCDL